MRYARAFEGVRDTMWNWRHTKECFNGRRIPPHRVPSCGTGAAINRVLQRRTVLPSRIPSSAFPTSVFYRVITSIETAQNCVKVVHRATVVAGESCILQNPKPKGRESRARGEIETNREIPVVDAMSYLQVVRHFGGLMILL